MGQFPVQAAQRQGAAEACRLVPFRRLQEIGPRRWQAKSQDLAEVGDQTPLPDPPSASSQAEQPLEHLHLP
jgi:hypothetical protein